MEQDTNKLMEEQLKSLPLALQRAIALTPWRNFVTDVSRANNLNEDQSKYLETETMLVIYGFENQNDFTNNIVGELSVDISKATAIAKEIDNQVFTIVLSKANELNIAGKEETLQSGNEKDPNIQTTTVIAERPNDLPMVVVGERPKTALTFEERKKLVPNIPDNKVHYEGGKDPYREEF